ncbi:hypothetical protein [Pararhizobium gei]|uniref:hypothetical protein n=1 Tax=Pararhizobium gei TaxID=1395951 RepID=UPI0023DC5846|nr:hypothetical protein [Rhizobium gei]
MKNDKVQIFIDASLSKAAAELACASFQFEKGITLSSWARQEVAEISVRRRILEAAVVRRDVLDPHEDYWKNFGLFAFIMIKCGLGKHPGNLGEKHNAH